MNIEKQKCINIKRLVQDASGLEDIGKRTRKRHYIEFKKIYCKICKTFTSASLETIGEVLGGYDHASALHSIKTFDNLYSTNGLDFKHIYERIVKKLNEDKISLLRADVKIPETVPELYQKFRISLIKIIEKSHSIINKKQNRIEELQSVLEEAFEIIDPSKENYIEELLVMRTKIKRTLLK